MRKRRRPLRLTVVDRSPHVDVVSQLECAIRYPQATLIGALAGGMVPWFARALAHEEVPAAWSAGHRELVLAMVVAVLGCACFSALTVYKFGLAAFGDARKAIGFVLALEGVMLLSHGTASGIALAVLVAINAIANGSRIALDRAATCRRREADARRAATRARRQAPRSSAGSVAPRQPRASWTPAPAPRWDDIVDAEIISEERLLS